MVQNIIDFSLMHHPLSSDRKLHFIQCFLIIRTFFAALCSHIQNVLIFSEPGKYCTCQPVFQMSFCIQEIQQILFRDGLFTAKIL